jgi:hypothetical protein
MEYGLTFAIYLNRNDNFLNYIRRYSTEVVMGHLFIPSTGY